MDTQIELKHEAKGLPKPNRRHFVILGALLLIALAVVLNVVMFTNQTPVTENPDTNTNVTPDDTTNGDSTAVDGYFSATQVSRQRARDEAIEVLQAVVDNVDATETAKTEALAGISAIAQEIQKEANIESLITAKGFEKCVAVLNGETATIVVSADTLQPADLAQINAIVYEQTGITPAGITIVNK